MTLRPTPAEWARMNWYQRDRWAKRRAAELKPRTVPPPPPVDEWSTPRLRAAHASYERGNRHPEVVALQREYDAARKRAARAQVAARIEQLRDEGFTFEEIGELLDITAKSARQRWRLYATRQAERAAA